MARKSPIKHPVKESTRKGRRVSSHDRGSGSRSSNPHGSSYISPRTGKVEKFVSRPKSEFKSPRSAWMNIADDTGIPEENIIGRPHHTSTLWVWKVQEN